MARKLRFSRGSQDITDLTDRFQQLTLEDRYVDNDIQMTSPGREQWLTLEDSYIDNDVQMTSPEREQRLGSIPDPPYRNLLQCLIRPDAQVFFLRSCEDIYLAWTSLQQSTMFASDIPCTDTLVTSALSYLDAIITDRGNSRILRRLAYIRLSSTLASLYELISNDRQYAPARPRKRQVHSVAVDIYLRAQAGKSRRSELLRRMNLGKRWSDLAGPSPLLVATYLDDAEQVVYGSVFEIVRGLC